MREDITVHNFADRPVRCELEVAIDADFADVFAVKEDRAPEAHAHVEASEGVLVLGPADGSPRRSSLIRSTVPYRMVGPCLVFDLDLDVDGVWSGCLEVGTAFNRSPVAP